MKKITIIGMIWVSIIAVSCFLFSYTAIFRMLANGNVLTSTIFNFVFIITICIWDDVQDIRHKKKHPNGDKEKSNIYIKVYRIVSFTPALYLFHFGVQICVAIIAAEPDIPILGDMSDYFLSVQYGLFVLLAGNIFSESIFKDLSNIEAIIEEETKHDPS
jgi:hypothetical protein